MEGFIGQIIMVAFNNFIPQGWALCNGQLLSIEQYNAVYALLGTQYGGDGHSTFALPDLRGRTAIGQGQSAETSTTYNLAETLGSENMTLINQPGTTHSLTLSNGPSLAQTGIPAPFSVIQPSLVVNYIICLEGVFPTAD
jgi:microcystin-dependent protein